VPGRPLGALYVVAVTSKGFRASWRGESGVAVAEGVSARAAAMRDEMVKRMMWGC
jgi:hypothetical protein